MILDFICTYHMIDDNEESNILYKIQILQAFNLSELDTFHEEKIQNEIKELFNKYKNYKQLENIIDMVKKKHNLLLIKDNIIFIILFSYDYFYIFLSCLRDLENNNIISDKNYNKLIDIIK